MQDASVIKSLFRSLRHRNFRLFFMGRLVSLVGAWMQKAAQGLVYVEKTLDMVG
jgi:hypothetical protein